jgi:hypothetical protein
MSSQVLRNESVLFSGITTASGEGSHSQTFCWLAGSAIQTSLLTGDLSVPCCIIDGSRSQVANSPPLWTLATPHFSLTHVRSGRAAANEVLPVGAANAKSVQATALH